MSEQLSSFEGIELTFNDESVVTNVITTDSNPASIGLSAPVGSLALSTTGRGYYKHNTLDTDWATVFTQLPNEFSSLIQQKTGLSTSDKLIIEDSASSFTKKGVTLQEIVNLVSVSGSLPYYEFFEDNDIAVTVCPTPFQVFSATTQTIPAGKYRIAWTYMWNTARALSHFNAKILIDGVEVFYHRQLDLDADKLLEFGITCSDNRLSVSSFKSLDFLTETTHTIEMQIFTDDTSYQVSSWNRFFEIQRVG